MELQPSTNLWSSSIQVGVEESGSTYPWSPKDGKDSVTFSFGKPTGDPVGPPRTWTSGSPWAWMPQPWNTRPKRRKTPSQLRRDQKRRQEFFAKKESPAGVKKELVENHDKSAKANLKNPEDEIDLKEISSQVQVEVDEMFKIEGEYKNPKFKPWTVVEPEKEFKTLWELIKTDNKTMGIEEIGEGSATFEHCFEFWGTWRIKKPGITLNYLENSENWPKGIKITDVKSA